MTNPIKIRRRNSDQESFEISLERMDDAAFQVACENRNVKSMKIWMCKVRDFSPISKLTRLESLTIGDFSRGNLQMLRPLTRLKRLSLCHFPKEHDLSPIAELRLLEDLELECLFSWLVHGKSMQWDSVEPLSKLKNLTRLLLGRVEIGKGGLYPLGELRNLKKLICCNNHSTQEYAYLAGKLPNAKGSCLVPFDTSNGPPCKKCGSDMMLMAGIHRRGAACPKCDPDRLKTHAAEFERLKNLAITQKRGWK